MKTLRCITALFVCVALLSCGAARQNAVRIQQSSAQVTVASLADSVWVFSQAHPEGYTLHLATWSEPREGIAVAYEETQSRHDRKDLEFVISHALEHDGFIGGWFNEEDGRYYFDSDRLFPEDSLAQALAFAKSNHQLAVYILSSGTEIRVEQ